MRNHRSAFVPLLVALASLSGCAPIDGEELGTSSEALLIPGTYSVCSSAPQALACQTTSLRRTADWGLSPAAPSFDLSADPFDPVARTCTTTTDCVAAALPTNSCGGYRYLGINRVSLGNFNAYASGCLALYVACSPYQASYTADDDRTWTNYKLQPRVSCCAGRCVTAAPL